MNKVANKEVLLIAQGSFTFSGIILLITSHLNSFFTSTSFMLLLFAVLGSTSSLLIYFVGNRQRFVYPIMNATELIFGVAFVIISLFPDQTNIPLGSTLQPIYLMFLLSVSLIVFTRIVRFKNIDIFE